MVALETLRLQDFETFAPLADIAGEAGAEIILHGGTAFRATLFAAYQDRLDVDLFDLAPFNSDIDLDHDGSPEQTTEIHRLIQEHIPFASWCRWSVNDAERAALARAQRRVSTDVPLRRIRLSTGAPAEIPAQAMRDIALGQVSFARNERFGDTADAARPDLELFGLMMALNTWDEASEIAGREMRLDVQRAEAWLDEGLTDDAHRLLDQPSVMARFWHLLTLRLARRGFDLFNRRLLEIGAPILAQMNVPPNLLTDRGRAISVSKLTSAADFRIPEVVPAIVTGEAAQEHFRAILRRAAKRIGWPKDQLPDDPIDLIDPSLELVGLVPDLTILPYGSATDGDQPDDPFLSGAEQEFVQFVWTVQPGQRIDPHALTGQLLALGAVDLGACTALPVVGGTFGTDRAWVRARLDDLIERGEEGASAEGVMLILQARPVEAAGAENDPILRDDDGPQEEVALEPVYQAQTA